MGNPKLALRAPVAALCQDNLCIPVTLSTL